ncbi:hypothetical protein HDU96_004426 [Phlyctochytrium bullatum]|nr:hypothetical protein HDU96_004426 [Phlyctochytrium bullatum]
MSPSTRSLWLLALSLLASSSSSPVDAAACGCRVNVDNVKVSTLLAFGDSLTDSGRGREITSKANIGFTAPSDAYFDGRFSNGPTWVENVATSKNAKLINRAVGGATTSDKNLVGFIGDLANITRRVLVPGVDTQIAEYIGFASSGDREAAATLCRPSTLATIWIGGNDKLQTEFFKLNQTGDFYAKPNLDHWKALANAGVTKILQILSARTTPFDAAYNDEVVKLAETFRKEFPAVKLEIMDASAVFLPILADPKSGGFSFPSTEVCCKECFKGKAGAQICSNPDEYLIWDDVHPTAAVHRLMGKAVTEFIETKFGFA